MKLEQSLTEGLKAFGDVSDYLAHIVKSGVYSTLDTQMIIDDADFHSVEPGKPLPREQRKTFSQAEQDIEALLTDFDQKGLVGNFHQLVNKFGQLLFATIASEDQVREVNSWHEQGLAKYGGFLMADAGGPSIQQWTTVFAADGDNLRVNVNKIWIIEGDKLDYGTVSAASTQKLYPTSILIPPEQFKTLKKVATGLPFLDGTLQLGSVSGEVTVPRTNMLTNGGLASTSVFLATVRPRFVRSLMGHVLWLHKNNRATLSDKQLVAVKSLADIAKNYCYSLVESKASLPTAMTIKFTSNRILLDLVISGAIKQQTDQRDLMAFTRMEGSSYRCLYEIYAKTKAR